ncbi:MAG: hypothetical protein MASP_00613 [Candidatus Methanolliviera sp. GoM_asphalt]|nr:MAG: hypothetical protein MASP_00613 [Candidatus Methanolliviera sp. GoM_asphalt]
MVYPTMEEPRKMMIENLGMRWHRVWQVIRDAEDV